MLGVGAHTILVPEKRRQEDGQELRSLNSEYQGSLNYRLRHDLKTTLHQNKQLTITHTHVHAQFSCRLVHWFIYQF